MKQTPNINLPILESGDKYLKETQNDAFIKIDKEMEGFKEALNAIDNVEGSIIETKADVNKLKENKADKVETDNKFLEIGSSLETIVHNKLKLRVNINEYIHLIENKGLDNECWSNAFTTAMNELSDGGELFVGGGIYNFQKTIDFKSGVEINGIKNSTIFKLNVNDLILLNMYDNANMGVIKNITFQGSGKDNGQTGIDLKGWNTTISNCKFIGFENGIDCKGVLINIDSCYIVNNNKGIFINQLTNGVFSTMINVTKSLIHYNTDGIYASDNGDVNAKRPMILFNLESSALEHNTYAFRIPGTIGGKISSCWFEGNDNRPQTHETGWVIEHNRFETDNQQIEFLARAWQTQGFGGITEITDGKISTKQVFLKEFNGTNLRPTSEKIINLSNGNLQFNGENIMTHPNSSKLKTYTILIYNDEVKQSTLASEYYTFTKLGVGIYKIKFNGTYDIRKPIINASATNVWGGQGSICALYTSFVDESSYKNYFSVDEIIIKTYESSTMQLKDSIVMLSITVDKIYQR